MKDSRFTTKDGEGVENQRPINDGASWIMQFFNKNSGPPYTQIHCNSSHFWLHFSEPETFQVHVRNSLQTQHPPLTWRKFWCSMPYAWWWFNLSLQLLANWFREDVYKKRGLYGPKSLALVQVLWSCGKLRCLQSHRHHERICADVVYIWLWSFAVNPQVLIDKKPKYFG